MKKNTFILILLTVLLGLTAFSLSAQYEGKARMKGIVSGPDGNPLAGVVVKLYSLRAGAGFDTKTDAKGVWKAMWVRAGDWNIDFTKQGYAPKKVGASLKSGADVITIKTTLDILKGPAIKQELMKDFDKGNRLFSEGKIDKALAVFEKILQENPDTYALNLNIGNCYFDKKEYEKAISAYQKVTAEEPDHSGAILSIGNSYSNMKKNTEAMEWYGKLDAAKINDPVVLYNIGVIQFNGGNAKGAVDFFKRSVTVKPDFLDGWYQLGMSYMNEGNNTAAIAALETFLKHDNESEKAKQVREILSALKQ